jgi:flavin-dependent dehydrogenase
VSTSKDFDAIVIGGGPAGSTVGTLLADAGRRVLLLEKERFPRYHIGESLLSATVTIFEKLGVLEKIEKAGHTKKHGISWVWGKDRSLWTVYFKDAIGIPHDFSFQVERGAFDKMLLDNAREHGVSVLEEAPVNGLIRAGGRLAGVQYGNGQKATAPWIVDASGQTGFLSNQVSKRNWDDHLRNMAVWSYWKNARRPEGIDRGNTFLPTFQEGWWWFIPLRDEITSVGVVIDRKNYDKALKQGLHVYYRKAIERTPELAQRLHSAQMVDEMRVTRDWSYLHESFCGEGYFAVGDSACFIDPLLSTGVHLAMLSGYLAAVSINTLLEESSADENRIQGFFQEQYFREYSRLREKVYFMYGGHRAKPDSYFWNARKIFDIPTQDPKRSFISLIAGAFEHRSWYRRFAKELEVPNSVHELAESIFSRRTRGRGGVSLEKPLVRTEDWKIKDDFAVDGFRLREVKVLASSEGRTFPLDETMSQILDGIDGRTSCRQMVAKIGGRNERLETSVRSRLSEAVALGILSV